MPSRKLMRKVLSVKHREQILQSCHGLCAYCGTPIDLKSMQVDHGVPIVLQDSINRFPDYTQLPTNNLNDNWNLFPACRSCNNWKGGMTIKEFRYELSKQVERCEKMSRNYRTALRFGMIQVIKTTASFLIDRIAPMCVTEFDTSKCIERAISREALTNTKQ